MAVPFIAASGAAWTVNDTGGGTASTITLTKPTDATINAGDLLVMIVGNDDANPAAGEWNDVTGWTREFQIGSNASDCAMAVYWRIADEGEAATQAVTCDTNNELYGWYIHIQGNSAIPMDANGPGTAVEVASGADHDVTGFTVADADRLAFCIGAFDGGDGHAFVITGTGWTLGDSQQSGSGGTDASGCWATKDVASGATGTCNVNPAVSDGFSGIQFAIASPVVSITDVETTEEIDDKQTGVTITGTLFEAAQGTGKVEISDNATYGSGNVVGQTETSWGDTAIDITVVLGAMAPGTPRYVWVTNDSGLRNSIGFPVTVHRAHAFGLAASGNIAASGENTTFQLTAPATKSTADFGGGRIQDDENPGDTVDIAADEYREDEWCIEAVADADDAVQYEFRVLIDGSPAATLTAIPKWTIGSGGSTDFQTVGATAVGVAGLTAVPTFVRALPATAIGVAAFQRTISKTLAATAIGTTALTTVATHLRTLAATAVGVAALTAAPTFVRTLAATAVGVAVLTAVPTFVRTLAATAVGVAILATTATHFLTLAATAVGAAALTTVATHLRTLAATAVGVATLTPVPIFVRALVATAVGVAGVAAKQVIGITMGATAVGVAALTAVPIFVRTLAATAVGSAALTTVATHLRTLAATAVGMAAFQRTVGKTLAATATGVAALTAASVFARTLAATAIGVATLANIATFVRTLAATATGVATLATTATHFLTLAATAVGSAAFQRTIGKTLAATAVGVAALAPATIFVRALAATAVGVVGVVAQQLIIKTLAATAVGVATLTAVPTFVRTLAATAVGAVTLATIATHFRTLAATAVGVAAFQRTVGKTLAATAIGVSSLGMTLFASVTLAAIATGQAGMSMLQLFSQTLSAVATGISSLVTNFIAGGPPPPPPTGTRFIMQTVTHSFTEAEDGPVLVVGNRPAVIDWSISGTYSGHVLTVERSKAGRTGGWDVISGPHTVDDALVTGSFQGNPQELFRINVEDVDSGSDDVTGTIVTVLTEEDRIIEEFKDAMGGVILRLKESGLEIPGTIAVTGVSTLTGAVDAVAGVSSDVLGVGVVNGAGVSVVESGNGIAQKTVLTLTNHLIAVTDALAYAGSKIYDFPEGRILILGVTVSLAFGVTGTRASTINANAAMDYALGTVTASTTALATTMVDLLPKVDHTLDGVDDAYTTAAGAALAASAQFDGTGTPKDMFLNVAFPTGTDIDADGELKVLGTITIHWINLGDF